MLIGANSPTQGYTARGQRAAEIFGPGIMLWLPSAAAENAAQYPGCIHILRCANWVAGQDPDDYARAIRPFVEPWLAVPNLLLQLGNEPDIEAGHNGAGFARYAAAAKRLWPAVKVGNPPLSVEGSALADFTDADARLVHSYFERQHPEAMGDPQFGRSYLHALGGGVPVYVTEFNVVQTACPIDWPDRNRQAAAWINQARGDGVAGVCLFLLDNGDQWASFDIGPEAAADILADLARPIPPPPPPAPPPATDIPSLLAAIGTVAGGDDHLFNAMLMGAALETALRNVAQYGGGPGRGYWQIEAGPGGSHEGEITERDAFDPLAAATFMAGAFRAACASVFAPGVDADSEVNLSVAAFRAERPAAMYPSDRMDAAWTLIQPYLRRGVAPRFEIVPPVDDPVVEGSDGSFSHGGKVAGFYAIDYGSPIGTPIRAAADGTVKIIYWQDSNPISLRTGHSTYIEHDNGYATFSCHQTTTVVAVGDRVAQGQIIGTTGDPNSQPDNGFGSGPHLHWEIWRPSYFAGGGRVKMEDLLAAGIAGPWSDPPPIEEIDMQIDGHYDDGRIARLWNGPKTAAQIKKTGGFDATRGIDQRWLAEYKAGRPLGFAVSGEEKVATGGVIRYFSNGFINYYPDGTTTVN